MNLRRLSATPGTGHRFPRACPPGSSCAVPFSRRSEKILDRRLKLGDGLDAWRELQHSILRPRDDVGSSRKGGLRSGRTVFDGNTLLRLKPEKRRRPLIGLRVALTVAGWTRLEPPRADG